MARAALKKGAKSAAKPVKPGRRAAAVKPGKAVKAGAKGKSPGIVRAPVVSKDELRGQLEKALATITALRAKGREASRAAKASALRIGELEAAVARLEKASSVRERHVKPAAPTQAPVKRRGRKAAVESAPDAPVEPPAAPADAETPDVSGE